MSDTDEEVNLSYLEMPDILGSDSDEEDNIVLLKVSDSSLKTKKSRQDESESSYTESESERDSSLKKRGKSERSLQKKKKKKKSRQDYSESESSYTESVSERDLSLKKNGKSERSLQKKKKSRQNYSESESSYTESVSERDLSLKKKGKSERSLKKKKKKKSRDDSTTPKSSTASMNKGSDGSKRKKKVSTIDMAGEVTKISKPKSKRKLKTRDPELDGEHELPKKKNWDRTEDGAKKKKKSQRSGNEIESSSKKKKKKKRPPSDDNGKQDRDIPYGDIVSFNHNELAQGKRISESTLESSDYDEEDQNVPLSRKGKMKADSTEKTVEARFSGSTLSSIVERYNSSSRKNIDRKSPSVRTRREYDGEYTDADEDDEDDHHIFIDDDDDDDDDDDEYTDDEEDVSHMRRKLGYSIALNDGNDGFYCDSFYDLNGFEDERPSFKHVTMDLPDTGICNTKCCLIFAGLFFICTTIGTSILIGKLTKSDEW